MQNESINRSLLAGFAEEVRGYAPRILHRLETLPMSGFQPEALEEPHRLVHSIKGASSMIGLASMSHVGYMVESAIEEIAGGMLPWNAATQAALRHAIQALGSYADLVMAGSSGRAREGLESAVVAFRRLRGEPESGDAAAIAETIDPSEVRVTDGPEPSGGSAVKAAAAAPKKTIPADILSVFQQEADEILHSLGELLRSKEAAGALESALPDVRRQVHTLKGAAGSVGVTEMATLAHRLEDLLDELNEGSRQFDEEARRLLFATFDLLSEIAESPEAESNANRVAEMTGRFDAMTPVTRDEPTEEPLREAISPDLLDAFRAEAEENLRLIGDRLRTIEKDPSNRDALLEVRRVVHTVKGASNVVGLALIADVCHQMENLLDEIAASPEGVAAESVRLLFAVLDLLTDGFSGELTERELLQAYAAVLERHANEGKPAMEPLEEEHAIEVPAEAVETKPAAKREPSPAARPATPSTQYVRVPLDRLDALIRLVSELVVNRSVFEQHLAAYEREVGELGLSIDRLRRVSGSIATDFEVSNLTSGNGTLAVRAVVNSIDKRSDFDALEFDRYTNLHLVGRDLNETTSDLESAAGELNHRISDFDSYLNRLGLLTGELQDRMMRLRMVPLASVATRLHRTVRTTGEKLGKQVDLVISGENVEFDKKVLEEICGPLEHLLRNAVDHGMESESMRRVLDKPARGRIEIQAANEGTQVVLRVSDDGGGMDPEALRAAALRTGIRSEEQLTGMTDQEVCELIFEPGFTTARTVSETSGRGVGMDVVQSAVRALEGTIQVDTRYGKGTTFIIRLPMTLAVLRVLLVRANEETFAVPLGVVNQIMRVEPHNVERIGNKPVVRIGRDVVPVAHLGELLRLPNPPDPSVKRRPVLVMSLGGQRMAVMVDRLMEAREVVVKGLGTLVRKAPGISGATLMGDGSVVLIVNPGELAPGFEESSRITTRISAETPAPQRKALEVMVVDDSVSVRRVLTNLMKNNGCTVTAAKDGLEALEILQRGHTPDVILLDIEMPRMDGYELTAAVRANPTLSPLPIVMLTSRSGDKHRKKAFELGATDYLVKPYQEETLLSVMRRVVRDAREAAVR
ncbi:MAG: Hpt domain-containing protein [Bryobacteraceae bacterium]